MTTDLAAHIPAWVDGVLQPVGKLETHQRGLKHPAVSVMIMQGDRMLIQRRALGKYHTPGLWANTCCTHPHWEEAPEDCAHRRLCEELGITGQALVHRGQIEYRAEVGGGLVEHELVDVFFAEATADLAPDPNPAEVMDTRWIAVDDLEGELASTPGRFVPWLKIYMDGHRDQILGGSSS